MCAELVSSHGWDGYRGYTGSDVDRGKSGTDIERGKGRIALSRRLRRTLSDGLYLSQPGIEPVSQPVSEEVEREHRQEYGHAGEESDPPRCGQI